MVCRAPGRLVVAALAVVLAGCGGDIKADELDRAVQTVGSYAAEGALLADGVAHDRSRATFTRVQARTLSDLADHEAERLADSSSSAAMTGRRRDAIRLAEEVSDAVGALKVRPGDEPAGVAAAKRLRELAHRADVLSEAL